MGRLWEKVRNPALYVALTVLLSFSGLLIYAQLTSPMPTKEQLQRQQEQRAQRIQREKEQQAEKRKLCQLASACQKYGDVRLACATADSLKACIHIKMGDEARYIDTCSAGIEGGLPAPPLPNSPNKVECFFLQGISKFGI